MDAKFWKGKIVLVTGATGLVGSHTVEKLVSAGADAIALVRSKNPKAYFYSQGLDGKAISAYGDLKDFARVWDVITRYEVEYVIHLGAQPLVTTALANPLETFRDNVDGTLNVLEAARLSPLVKGVVVASSDKAYGKSDKLPYTEDMPMRGEAPYEASKSCTDIVALAYAKTYGMPVSVARFGNVYGPGDLNFSRIVPGAIKAGLLDQQLEIRSDGKMVREYIYAGDVADGYLLLAQSMAKAKGEAFNFGSGERLSVLEVVEKVGLALGRRVRTKILDNAKNEIPEQYLSSEKAKKALGWKSQIGFEKGIGLALPWYKKFVS